MLYSSFKNITVEMPLSPKAYETHLKKLIATSKPVKKAKTPAKIAEDMSASFGIKA
jgi:hypothetical protein